MRTGLEPQILIVFRWIKKFVQSIRNSERSKVATWLTKDSHKRRHFENFRMLDNETGSFKYTYDSSSSSGGMNCQKHIYIYIYIYIMVVVKTG